MAKGLFLTLYKNVFGEKCQNAQANFVKNTQIAYKLTKVHKMEKQYIAKKTKRKMYNVIKTRILHKNLKIKIKKEYQDGKVALF